MSLVVSDKIPDMSEQYDQTSPKDIERYGRRLRGNTLRLTPGMKAIPVERLETLIGGHTKASFGYLLERYYYGINPGNVSAPDFPKAGVELKSTPLKLSRGSYAAKERLVLNIINYKKEAKVADFTTSSFLKKNARIMLIAYEHGLERAAVDNPVHIAQLLDFNRLPEKDQRIIEADWNRIVKKIRDGKAHELSEGDTDYLSACTKAAKGTDSREQAAGGPRAKPRAFSFKAGYMTVLLQQILQPAVADKEYEAAVEDPKVLARKSFEDEIIGRFSRFIGKSVGEIHQVLGKGLNIKSKDYFAMLARRMIGVHKKKIEEFEKAEISMKTIQLRGNGMPKEDMSFPAFKFLDVTKEVWNAEDDSERVPTFKKQLQNRFLFVVYQCDKDCKSDDNKKLVKAFFWTMPNEVLDDEVRKVWSKTKAAIRASDVERLPKKSENRIAHVRPHGRNADDTDTLPNGKEETKRCFWLNSQFIKQQIANN